VTAWAWGALWLLSAGCTQTPPDAPLTTEAAATPRAILEDIPFEAQPRGPSCVAAATAMVLRFHGAPATLDALTIMRSVPVWPDGIALFDVQQYVTEQGYESLVFQAEAHELEALVRAGLPPIVLVAPTPHQPGRHALVVNGYTADTVHRLDPATPALRTEERASFERRLRDAGSATLLLLDRGRGDEVPGVDLSSLRARNRQFRGAAWALRAEEHAEANPQKAELYRRAVDEDPTSAPLRNNFALVLAALGDEPLAIEQLERAVALDPSFAPARQNLAKLRARGAPGAP